MPRNPNEKPFFDSGKGTKLMRAHGIREVGPMDNMPWFPNTGMVIGTHKAKPSAQLNNLDKACYQHHGNVIGPKPGAPLKQSPMRRGIDKVPAASKLFRRGDRNF